MNFMTPASRIVPFRERSQGIEEGPVSCAAVRISSHALGWFSIALGVTQVLAAPRHACAGPAGPRDSARACGAREIGHGLLSLSTQRQAGLWSRVGGDTLDIAALASAMRRQPEARQCRNCTRGGPGHHGARHRGRTSSHRPAQPSQDRGRDYSDRSGFLRVSSAPAMRPATSICGRT